MQTQAEFNPEKVWGSVMEVETGKILAWGQSPSFEDVYKRQQRIQRRQAADLIPMNLAQQLQTGALNPRSGIASVHG